MCDNGCANRDSRVQLHRIECAGLESFILTPSIRLVLKLVWFNSIIFRSAEHFAIRCYGSVAYAFMWYLSVHL